MQQMHESGRNCQPAMAATAMQQASKYVSQYPDRAEDTEYHESHILHRCAIIQCPEKHQNYLQLRAMRASRSSCDCTPRLILA